MLCPRCHGKREGFAEVWTWPEIVEEASQMLAQSNPFNPFNNLPSLLHERIVCPYCEGIGVVNCCDGDSAQNEIAEEVMRQDYDLLRQLAEK